MRVDALPLDPAAVTLVVPTRTWERWFQRQHEERRRGPFGFLPRGLGRGAPFPWHFVVLEDIGVDIPVDVAPPP